MINSYDCVTLSDDDTPTQAKRTRKRKKEKKAKLKSSGSMETIVIEDEMNNNDNNNIIEIPDSQNYAKDKPLTATEKIYRENELFSDFLEKCLNLENSDGMTSIVNKTIIKAYEETDEEYKKSDKFKKVVLKALGRLETDPDHKFSHVKDFVETLRFHKVKKRVQLTTLATNLKENSTKRKNGLHKSTKTNSISLDSDDDQRDIPTINLDEYTNDVVDLEKTDEEKENQRDVEESNSMSNSNNQENFLVPQVEVPWEPGHSQTVLVEKQIIPVEYESAEPAIDKQKIQSIISQIQWCKEQINRLEETEVDEDSVTSPYLLCEKYKLQVVELYKDLCKFIGGQPIKRRKVRLHVLEGHPPGPVRRLQSFINDNIGEDGHPMFPDFCDVVKCVMVANIEDKLGWNKPQVVNEANALFVQCGRALQRQRQRREYRDLLAKVKLERPELDPADEDPELMRKLEENRRVAMKNENDLLERYVKLQYLPPQKQKPGPSLKVPAETLSNGDENIEQSQEIAVEDDQPQPSPCNDLISDEDSNFEPPEVLLRLDKTELDVNSENISSDKDNIEVKVKQEKMDIVQMLEDLGDHYTVSVIDIEDPFLVIEISSDDDTSDEETHVEGESNVAS